MAKKAEATILSIYLEEHFALEQLFEMGFLKVGGRYIKSKQDWPGIAERIRTFYGLKTIYHYHLLPPFGPGIPEETTVPAYVAPGEWLMQDNRLVNLIANN